MALCNRDLRLPLVIFALALALRMAFFALNADNPLLYSQDLDEAYYINLGQTIADGYILGENRAFFMDPLYGYILGLLFFLFGDNLTTVRLLQILVDSFNVVIIFMIGSRFWNRTAGIAGAVIYAMYSVSFFYSLLILKTTFEVSCLLVFVYLVLLALESRSKFHWFCLGALLGILTYLRANFVLLVPLALLSLWVIERLAWRELFRIGSVFVMGFLVLLSVGALRNYWVSGDTEFLISQSGRLLYSCNNPENLTGAFDVPSFSRSRPEESEVDFHREAERRLGKSLSVSEVSRYWRNETLKFLERNPTVAFRLLGNKLKWTVANFEMPMNQSYYVAERFSGFDKWPLPGFAFAFALGAPGLVVGIRNRNRLSWLLLPIVIVVITMLLFCSSSRFRLPAVPFLVIGAGISISVLISWVRERTVLKVLIFSLATTFLFSVSMAIPRPPPTGFEELLLARAYWAQGDYLKARNIALKAFEEFPRNADFPVVLGVISLSENRISDAIAYNQLAIRISPGKAIAYHNLGVAYLNAGAPRMALDSLRRALDLSGDDKCLFNLARAHEALGEMELARKYYETFLRIAKPLDPLRETAQSKLVEIEGK